MPRKKDKNKNRGKTYDKFKREYKRRAVRSMYTGKGGGKVERSKPKKKDK